MIVNLSPAEVGFLYNKVKDERAEIKYDLLRAIRDWHNKNKETMMAGIALDLLESYCEEWNIPFSAITDGSLDDLPF